MDWNWTGKALLLNSVCLFSVAASYLINTSNSISTLFSFFAPQASTDEQSKSNSIHYNFLSDESYRLFNNQRYFLSSYPYTIHSMRNPAIVIIGCNRFLFMVTLLQSLSKMPSIHAYTVYLSFGCPEHLSSTDSSVASELLSHFPALRFLSYKDPSESERPPPYLRIQLHYAFILKQVFEVHNHSEVILLEDDLEVSPSLLNYFEQTFHLLYQDPTLLCISAFNDNAYLYSFVSTNRLADRADNQRMRRSEFFPNLALLFNRDGYKRVWKDQPLNSTTNGWDHWLRIRIGSLQGECAYPVVPRVRHTSSKNSSTVPSSLANRLQKYPLVEESEVDLGNLSYLFQPNYDYSLLSSFLHPSSVFPAVSRMNYPIRSFLGSFRDVQHLYHRNVQLKQSVLVFEEGKEDIRKIKMYKDRVIVVYILRERFQPYVYSFNLFSSMRGFHNGILPINLKGSEVFFVERRSGWYVTPEQLQIQVNPWGTFVTGDKGASCDEACSALGIEYVCDGTQMQFVNHCNTMKEHFECARGCWNEVSNAVPTFCEEGKVYGGMCLISHDSFSFCNVGYPNTRRLCYCIQNATSILYPYTTPAIRTVITHRRKSVQ